jgi:hypothetical protein
VNGRRLAKHGGAAPATALRGGDEVDIAGVASLIFQPGEAAAAAPGTAAATAAGGAVPAAAAQADGYEDHLTCGICREVCSFPPQAAQRWPSSIARTIQPPCDSRSWGSAAAEGRAAPPLADLVQMRQPGSVVCTTFALQSAQLLV